jgi:putative GTP pyrophosphokinase
VTDLASNYQLRYRNALVPTAIRLEVLVSELLLDWKSIDSVRARAKSPDRFLEKARRDDGAGKAKYSVPLLEIQDQIGLRVVVFYEDNVPLVSQELLRYFVSIEDREVFPESPWEFGYFGMHHILVIPGDVVTDEVDQDLLPSFFELQIKTLFQHAWSEAEHDLGYKPEATLARHQKRLLAYSAAQAWGADRAVTEIRHDL